MKEVNTMFKFIGGIAVGVIAVINTEVWLYAIGLQLELKKLKQN